MKIIVNQHITRIFLCVFFMFALISQTIADTNRFTVVIDAGHGGRDPGAIGRTYKHQEKMINLNVALKLGSYIKNNYSDVRVIYTRTQDVFIELQHRADIANKSKADLFISIHTNANDNRRAYGSETYTLGLARSEANLAVAKRENSVILMEDNFSTKYEGFDPNSPESYIMFEFMQDKHMEQSINLASAIQNNFKRYSQRSDRGVRQAGFLVLRNTGMPSVLVELGYISNPEEEQFLASEDGQEKLANSIFKAFSSYKEEWERKQKRNLTTGTSVKSNTVPTVENSKTETTQVVNNTTERRTLSSENNRNNRVTETQSTKKNVTYKIQIMTSPEKYSSGSSKFRGLSPVTYYKEKNLYKYTFFETESRNEANKKLIQVKKKFKDAFVIAFDGNKRIL